MLKRSIIGITVVALLACIPQVWAGGDKSESWDYTINFIAKEVYRVDVKVKIPWWIKMTPQNAITLQQVTFYESDPGNSNYLKAKYEGSTVTNVIGNYAAELSCATEKNDNGNAVGGDWSCSIKNAAGNSNYDTPMVSMAFTIKVTIDKIDLSMKTPCETIVLGQCIIKVKPVGINATYTCP